MLTRISITGAGAVSPAGWGLGALASALDDGKKLAVEPMDRPGGGAADTRQHQVLKVPRPVPCRELAGHPRLRRASPVSLFAAAAAMEALGGEKPRAAGESGPRLGLVYTLMNGCVGYSRRFFGEVLENPATASPILFPETVFNAPASHLAAYLGITGPVHTLVGDSSQFLTGLDLAAMWIELGLVDACLVTGAEETDWLTAEALSLIAPGFPPSEGAAALLLERETPGRGTPAVVARTHVSSVAGRVAAAMATRKLAGSLPADTLLVDDLTGNRRADEPVTRAWRDWPGPRLSPLAVLGNGMGAACAWQCATAWHRVAEGSTPCAVAVASGGDQQSGALVFQQGG